jgi:membrane associated rhomboid family serine protease
MWPSLVALVRFATWHRKRDEMFPIKSNVPTRHEPFVTWGLIAINVVVFFWQLRLNDRELAIFLARYALIPGRIFALEHSPAAYPSSAYLPLLTNTFLHGGWLHLILNMWTLWLFGPAVEDRHGHGRFLVFYLTCGVLASITYALFEATSMMPALGASGAIAGLLGAYTVMFPFSGIIVLVPILFFPLFFAIPAIFFTGFWFLTQLVAGTSELFMPQASSGGIAWFAHIGGFIAGIVLAPLFRRSRSSYRAHYGDEGVLGFAPRSRR